MIIVTGADGFVGKYLVKQLMTEGRNVLAACHSYKSSEYFKQQGIPYIKLDVTNEKDFELLPKADTVVHLAALLRIDVSIYSPKDFILVNTLGTYNVLEYCRKMNTKCIYTMTHSDIHASKDVVITENTPREYHSDVSALPFIISKIAGADFIDVYDRDSKVHGIILRLSAIRGFGSRDTYYGGVFHQFIRKAINGEDIEIWGEHKTIRDLIYIKDVVSAITKCIDTKTAHGLYNIGTGNGLTILDEAKSIIKAFCKGRKSNIIFCPEKKEIRTKDVIFDISKAKKELDWEPLYTYNDAMVDMQYEMSTGLVEK